MIPKSVRLVEGVSHLTGHLEGNRYRERTLLEPVRQRLSLDEFHHDEQVLAILGNVEGGGDGWGAECGGGPSFSEKAGAPFGITAVLRGDELQGHIPPKPRVSGPVDFSHAARSNAITNLVVQQGASSRWHESLVGGPFLSMLPYVLFPRYREPNSNAAHPSR